MGRGSAELDFEREGVKHEARTDKTRNAYAILVGIHDGKYPAALSIDSDQNGVQWRTLVNTVAKYREQ